jgi:hypothetical protein
MALICFRKTNELMKVQRTQVGFAQGLLHNSSSIQAMANNHVVRNIVTATYLSPYLGFRVEANLQR